MNDTVIEAGAQVNRAIIDKQVRVGEGVMLGYGAENTPNRAAPDRLNTGLTLVGKHSIIAPGTRIGRNVVIYPSTTPQSYSAKEVPSGESISS